MKVYCHSLGCKTNEYETSALAEEIKEKGGEIVFIPEDADLIILNTCAVTSLSEKKSRQMFHRFKRVAPKAKILVMGCASEHHKDPFLESDVLLGTTSRKEAIQALIKAYYQDEKTHFPLLPLQKRRYEELGAAHLLEGARATLKIEDGCNNFCSYCLIPFLRGNPRSRKKEEVIKEAVLLTSFGVKELVLTGTHIGFYGKEEGMNLASLCKEILASCPSLHRLRLGSLEESELDEDLLSLYEKEERLAAHLHIPLQSGSKSVLERMQRKYTPDQFASSIKRLREVRPDISITTDVIAGFPLESEEEHQETLSFLKEMKFSRIHVFPYSKREGTRSSYLPDIPFEVRKGRTKEIMNLSSYLEDIYIQEMDGKEETLLVEKVKEGIAYGHLSCYLRVAHPAIGAKVGDILPILIKKEEVDKYDS